MSTIKNPTRFAELEYCLQGYFDGKLAPVMQQVRDDLTCLLLLIRMPTTPSLF